MRKLFFTFSILLMGVSSIKAQCSTEVLSAFGGLSTVAIYNSYLSIGAVADGYSCSQYDAEYVQTLMNEQISMADTIIGMFDNALADNSATGLDENDKYFVGELKVVFGFLKEEATGLRDYAANEDEASYQKFSDNRANAWNKISELLGFEE